MTAATIAPAGARDTGTVLALIEALLAELGDEGQEFAQIDRARVAEERRRFRLDVTGPGAEGGGA